MRRVDIAEGLSSHAHTHPGSEARVAQHRHVCRSKASKRRGTQPHKALELVSKLRQGPLVSFLCTPPKAPVRPFHGAEGTCVPCSTERPSGARS